MLSPVSPADEEAPSAVPTPRSSDPAPVTEPETFSFVDVEHDALDHVDIEAGAAAWDGFL
jgi:hypothetical protein